MKKIFSFVMIMLMLATAFAGSAEASYGANALGGANAIVVGENGEILEGSNGATDAAQIRQQTRAVVQGLEGERIQAMNNYAAVKKDTNELRQAMISKNAQIKECSDSDPTDAECTKIRTEARIASGDYLSNLADLLIKHLTEVQVRVKMSEEIWEEEQTRIIDIIEKRKERLESVKDEIEALKNEEINSEGVDNAELRSQIVEKLKNEVKEAKGFLKKVSLYVEARKIKELVAQQENAADKIEDMIQDLEITNAEDAGNLETLLGVMREDLSESLKYVGLAMNTGDDALLVEDDSLEDNKETTMRNNLNRARVELKDSYITLQKMVRIIKTNNAETARSELKEDSELASEESDEI